MANCTMSATYNTRLDYKCAHKEYIEFNKKNIQYKYFI